MTMTAPRKLDRRSQGDVLAIEHRALHTEDRLFTGSVRATADAIRRALYESRESDAQQLASALCVAAERRYRQIVSSDVA